MLPSTARKSTNAQHVQQQTSNDGRMRWRIMGRRQLKRHSRWSNGQATTVGGREATTALTTKKQKSTNEQWQRQRMTVAGKRQGMVLEAEE